ncbi:SaV protein [Synechococcus phage S-CREM2]|nr:SaV protein [Synechococcus phage S-CREM2]
MAHDAVNRPSHYAEGREFETIDVIEDWSLGYHLGNAVKYISRAGRKDDILQDLKKAQWYLNREIENLEIERAEVEGTLYELIEEKEEAPEVTYEDIRIDEAWEQAARLASSRADDILDVDDSTLDYWDDTVGGALHLSRRELDVRTIHAMCHGQGDCGWDPSVGPTC